MNRQEVMESYNVDPVNGIITSLGKFEGEMLYVPVAWKCCMDGGADVDEGSVYGVAFTDEDRAEFPEIGTAFGMLMEESEVGFVMTREFETEEAYNIAVDQLRQAEYSEEHSC